MKFEKLTIQNFMSIRTAEVELSNQGLILIQGNNNDDSAFESNGAGKSTIFEALTYSLFEKTVRGLKSDEIINENVGKNCAVFLDLKDDSGIPYRIARYRKHNEHKNNVYIYRDGKNITQKSSKDSNKFIEALIRMDYETFTNSILFGQGLVKMFSIASDSDKKAILEKMLSMTVFKEAQDKAKERLSEQKDEITKALANELRLKNLIEEVEATISTLKKTEEEHATNVNAEIERLSKELLQAEKDITQECMVATDEEMKLEKLNVLKTKIEQKLSKFDEFQESRNKLVGIMQATLLEKKKIETEVSELDKEAEKIRSGEGTNCPACGQEITKDTTEEALKHVSKKLTKLFIRKKELVSLLEEQKEDLTKVDKYLEGKKKLLEQKDTIFREISDINALIKTRDRIRNDLENRIKQLNDSIESRKNDLEKTYKPMIEEKEKQLELLNQKLVDTAKARSKLSEEVDLIEFWVKAFGNSGIKSYLLDSVTPFLNERANYYLSKLAGNTTEIEFSTQTRLKSGEVKEKFEIRINNLVGGTSYTANSTGERRRIDLAISLALQDLVMSRSNGKMNILLYDECFDGLDSVGCESVIQLLQEIQKDVESIFVITHNDFLKPYFDRYLVVTKENGQTTVKKE